MFKRSIAVAVATVFLSACASHADHHAAAPHAEAAAPHAEHHAHWSYDGTEGPDHWADMESKFSTCSNGKSQSPINITDSVHADLKPLKFNYQASGDTLLNNGHTLQVNFADGSSMDLNGHNYSLKQFHAHAPSENQINGKTFPMEVHFVHADANGNLAVIGVMFEEGAANPGLAKAWKAMPEQAGEKVALQENVLGTDIMPSDKSYYRFSGSLTTPPCTEGVTWLVLKKPVTASKAQIEGFMHLMHHHNNRPIQAINARIIAE